MITKSDDEKKMLSVEVNIPADAIIGKYKLTVEATTRLADGPKTNRKPMPDIFVLFNPFSPGKF